MTKLPIASITQRDMSNDPRRSQKSDYSKSNAQFEAERRQSEQRLLEF